MHSLVRVEPSDMDSVLDDSRWDLILADATAAQRPGPEADRFVQDLGHYAPVVVVADDEETTVRWLEAGAFDFITRPKFTGLWPLLVRLEHQREMHQTAG